VRFLIGLLALLPSLPWLIDDVSGQAAHPAHQTFLLGDFPLEAGPVLPAANLLFVTYGHVNHDSSNVVVTLSYHGGTHHGYDFLIGPGLALDTAKYFVVATEMFGSGGSSSPSNTPTPLDGPRFPPLSIRDNVGAIHRLLTERLGIRHVRAVVGYSMGAQQALQWAVTYPDFMDRVIAWCGSAKTYPHTWLVVEGGIRAWEAAADFNGGEYRGRPPKGAAASAAHWAAWVYSQEWWRRELYKPKYPTPEALMRAWAEDSTAQDPNDEIAQARAWQRHDLGRSPGFEGDLKRALRSIRAPVLLMPSASDLYFTAEDVQAESRYIARVKVVPIPSLRGHGAGSGSDPSDAAFLNQQIRGFLK
jgi:homoserine O-acetyltransferase/O-succinyltransferase